MQTIGNHNKVRVFIVLFFLIAGVNYCKTIYKTEYYLNNKKITKHEFLSKGKTGKEIIYNTNGQKKEEIQ